MFWKLPVLSAPSPVESVLDKENFTLEELLDEEEIIQECKALNSRLINFLRDRAQVEQLLRYIVEEPLEDADSKRIFKFPFIACEIFICEIDVILKTLVEEEELMNLLFSFLLPNRPHSALLAGYFSKVVICLMVRKMVPLMNYVQAHQDVFGHLVDLIGITSIMEVLIRLVGAYDHIYPNSLDVMQWLVDSSLLEMIVDKLSPLVFLVGKDFGSPVANFIALLHPKRVLGVVTLGVPFMPPRPPTHHNGLPEGFYISRWREPGRAEADFGRFDAKTVIRNIYILFSRSEIPIAAENKEIMDMVDSSRPLPPWFTEEDLETYGALYEKSGFRTALQVPYRAMHKRVDMPDPKVEAPSLLIMGEEDYVLKFQGIEDYIRSGEVKKFVPNLETIFLPQGSHFVHEQFPDQVNQLIVTFLNRHVQSI